MTDSIIFCPRILGCLLDMPKRYRFQIVSANNALDIRTPIALVVFDDGFEGTNYTLCCRGVKVSMSVVSAFEKDKRKFPSGELLGTI